VVLRPGAQGDCRDGAAFRFGARSSEIIRVTTPERTRFVLAWLDERLDQPGDVA